MVASPPVDPATGRPGTLPEDLALGTAVDALAALPFAVVLVDDSGRARWANRCALELASRKGPADLFEAIGGCAAVRAARHTGDSTAAVSAVPTDHGMLEREVTCTPLSEPPGWLVATFHVRADLRRTGPGDVEHLARLEAMLEHTTDIITVLDASGRILFSNSAARRVTGWEAGDVEGEPALQLVHPDDLGVAAEALGEAMAAPGALSRADLRIRFADGAFHPVEATIANRLDDPLVGGLVVTVHDVTEQRRAQEEVARSEARHRSLVEHLTDVIVVLDRDFQVTYASPAIRRIIHAPPDTNLGQSAFNDIHPDDLPLVQQVLADLVVSPLGTTTTVELRLESRPGTGQWRWIESVAVNRLDDPSVQGIVCTLRDITERREAATQLQAAYERERETAVQLRELDRLKDDFLATVSHEMRTPLAAIVGFADLLARDQLDGPTREEVLGRMQASAASMQAMVSNLLEFTALAAGRVRVTPQPVPLADSIARAVARMSGHWNGRRPVVETSPGLTAVADADGLAHVLRNLLLNAVRYSDPDSEVRITARAEAGHAVLAVADQGPGLTSEQLAQVFERFWRGPDAAHAGQRGAGIGLAIVKEYVHLMAGDVSATSTPGAGTTFTVRLPLAQGQV